MRKATNIEKGAASKSKRQQQTSINREANILSSGTGSSSGNGAVKDALI